MRIKLVVLLIAISVKIHGQTGDVLGSFTSQKSLIDSIENAIPGYKFYNVDSDAHNPAQQVIRFKRENGGLFRVQFTKSKDDNGTIFSGIYLYGDYTQIIALWKRWIDEKIDEKKLAAVGMGRCASPSKYYTINQQGDGWLIVGY
jgi:hypothetical protein